jgi:secondary thiamine-phosphate synthase enzyme
MEGHLLRSVAVPGVARLARRSAPGWNRSVATSGLVSLATRQPLELIDITDEVGAFARRTGLRVGWVSVQVLHTSAALFLNENEPLLLDDLVSLLERLAPRTAAYAHDDMSRRVQPEPEERPNGHAHAKALLLRASENVHVVGGALRLGRYQRLFLAELDGPRRREVSLVALGAK